MNTNKNKVLVLFVYCMLIFVVVTTFLAIFLSSKQETDDSYVATTPVVTEPTVATTPKILAIDTPVTYTSVAYTEFVTKQQVLAHKEIVAQHIVELDTLINSDDYTDYAVQVMTEERTRLSEIIDQLDCDIAMFEKWESEYYYSAMVWQILREQGFSETIVAAIIGNMMVETNPYCLEIEPYDQHKSGCHYGLCQWARKYYKEVMGASFEDQLVFLVKTMPKEFNRYGHIYKTGFDYEAFLEMTDVKKAATAFAKVYERCGTGSYPARRTCAKMAYDYFVNGKDTTPYAKNG